MNLILLGMPGCGKGTISGMLSERLKIPHVSSGDIIREEIRLKTKSGVKAEPFVNKGMLVPDDLMIDLIQDRLNEDDCKDGVILDGFPRTIPQADHLGGAGINLKRVINFKASDKTIIERLSGRRVCSECAAIFHLKNLPPKKEGVCDKCGGRLYQREDDKPGSINKRLKTYEMQTKPLIEYYKEKGLLADVDTEKPIPEIFKDTLAAIEQVFDSFSPIASFL